MSTLSVRKSQEKSPRADKRARLLEAALALFETRGYDAVAVPEIARAAGVATGTVYLYFRDKDALVNALYREWKGRYNETVLAPLPDTLTPRQVFWTYWQRMTRFARDFPRAVRFMDLHHHASYLDAESRESARAYARVAQEFVERAHRQGAIRNLEPALVVALMWGACTGLVKFAEQGALKFDAVAAAQMEDALWRAIATETGKGD